MSLHRRAVGLAVAVVSGAAFLAGPAIGATDPGTPSVTDVHVDGGQVMGVLTVPGAGTANAVAPGSVRVTMGSRPPVVATVSPIAQERQAALVMIDVSGSMAGGGLAAAKAAAREFLDQVPADVLVGLESFGNAPHVLVAPTTNRAPVRSALDGLRARGDTSLYDALGLGVRELGTSGSRTIVLLSDGADTVSHSTLASIEATVRSSGVRPVVVGFHTGDSQNGVLARIADAGQGAVTQAHDQASLQQAFGSAAREIAAQVRIAVPIPKGVGGKQHLTVSAIVGGHPVTTGVDVVLPAVAARPATAAPSAAPATIAPTVNNDALVWTAASAVFLALLILGLAVAGPQFVPAARRRIRQLDEYLTPTTEGEDAEAPRAIQGLSAGLTRAADRYIRNRPSAGRTGLLLERADLALQLNEWYVLRVLAVPISAVVFWVLFAGSGSRVVLTLLAIVLVAGVGPALALRQLAARRARRFELQLPDVLTLIASSLSTGFSLPQALDAITRDAADPAAKEFARALAETRIGVDLEDALDRTARRMGSTNLDWTTMAIRIQRRVGGNLADVMRTTAKTLRDRETLRRQVRALSAEGRLSAYILIAIPLLMALYLYVVNRPYLSLLWHRSVGVVMLSISSILLVIGVFWMRRIADVKV